MVLAWLAFAGCSRGSEPPTGGREPVRPVPVRVATLHAETVPETIEPVGTVRSRTQTALSARIVALVAAVHVREGQRVRAGDLLVTLDDRDASAQLRRARAARDEALQALEEVERTPRASERAQEAARAQEELSRATLARYRALFERELVAARDYDEAAARARAAAAEVARLADAHAALLARRSQMRARIEQAEADVAAAVVLAGYTKIHAPLDGGWSPSRPRSGSWPPRGWRW